MTAPFIPWPQGWSYPGKWQAGRNSNGVRYPSTARYVGAADGRFSVTAWHTDVAPAGAADWVEVAW